MLRSSPRTQEAISSLRPRQGLWGSGGLHYGQGGPQADRPCPRSLVQALLTVLSQVLCFLAVKAHRCSCGADCWNLSTTCVAGNTRASTAS